MTRGIRFTLYGVLGLCPMTNLRPVYTNACTGDRDRTSHDANLTPHGPGPVVKRYWRGNATESLESESFRTCKVWYCPGKLGDIRCSLWFLSILRL